MEILRVKYLNYNFNKLSPPLRLVTSAHNIKQEVPAQSSGHCKEPIGNIMKPSRRLRRLRDKSALRVSHIWYSKDRRNKATEATNRRV